MKCILLRIFSAFQKGTLLLTIIFATFVVSNGDYTFRNAGEVISWTVSDPSTLREMLRAESVEQTASGESVGISRSSAQYAVYFSPDIFSLAVALLWLICGVTYLGQGLVYVLRGASLVLASWPKRPPMGHGRMGFVQWLVAGMPREN